MTSQYHYPGKELELFKEAGQWKKYLASQIQPYICGDVLEVGAGTGETTSYLLNKKVRGWTCLEPDPRLFQELKNKLQSNTLPSYCKVVYGTVADLPPTSAYDAIVYIDVLEHIEDDELELASSTRYLKSGGYLIILSPAFQSLFGPFDKAIGHYRRYTKTSLRQIAFSKELEEKRIIYIESAGALLLLLNKYVIKKKYPSPREVWIWENVFIPISKVLDKILLNRVGKSIIGIWQKVNE